jgi:hypothetical protein
MRSAAGGRGDLSRILLPHTCLRALRPAGTRAVPPAAGFGPPTLPRRIRVACRAAEVSCWAVNRGRSPPIPNLLVATSEQPFGRRGSSAPGPHRPSRLRVHRFFRSWSCVRRRPAVRCASAGVAEQRGGDGGVDFVAHPPAYWTLASPRGGSEAIHLESLRAIHPACPGGWRGEEPKLRGDAPSPTPLQSSALYDAVSCGTRCKGGFR